MAITAALVKELRERTGLGMMECKKALEETDGNMDLAIEELRKKSALKAAKKAGRTTADGLLGVRIADDGKRAALVEVNIETDFAAKNEKFIAYVGDVLARAFETGEADVSALLAGDLGVRREQLVQEIGENVSGRRIAVSAPVTASSRPTCTVTTVRARWCSCRAGTRRSAAMLPCT